MSDNIRIRLNETDSLFSRNTDEYADINIEQTTNIVPNVSFNGIVDIDEIFRRERDACTKYNIILTVNPFCTNVLFNMCTEIVYDEGSEWQSPVLDTSSKDLSGYTIYGKQLGLNRTDMVRNTEYSREGVGVFTYHPGMDIFNNHLMRNKTNKVITYMSNQPHQDRNVFNTIEDYTRGHDGNPVWFEPRKELTSVQPVPIKKHQYIVDDIYGFINGESYAANISEDGGWLGFKNNTTIDAKDGNSDENPNAAPMDIGRVINSLGNCEFVDMYPDRSLFLFTPKYNEKRDRLEYNWDIELTYPYKNFYDHPLVRELVVDKDSGEFKTDGNGRYVFGNTYGLLMQDGKIGIKEKDDGTERMFFKFRSFVKHRLNRGVYLNIYYRMPIPRKRGYEKYEESVMVASIGDDNRDNADYYFSIVDDGLYYEMISKHCLDLFYTQVTNPSNPAQFVEYSHIPVMIPVYHLNRDIAYYEYVTDPSPMQTYTDEETFTEIPYETLYSPSRIRVVDENGTAYYMKDKLYYTFLGTITSQDDILGIAYNMFNHSTFRIRRVVSGVESEYYFRIFRKVPNFKFAHENLSEEYVDNGPVFEAFVDANASHEGPVMQPIMDKFDNEWYDLAFSRTIYGDQITQVAYSDPVDIDMLVDNLGRPLTKIYATIVKANNGYKDWYCRDDECGYGLDRIEYSRCFGAVTSGVPFLYTKEDRKDDRRRMKGFLSDARMLRNTDNGFDTMVLPRPKTLEWWYGKTDSIDAITDNEFFGDIVDFNPVNAYEITLEDVNFRFNTAQRESDDSIGKYVMTGDELVSDDYDLIEDEVESFSVESTPYTEAIIHPEGYIYKPHYEIMVRELSEARQDSHFRINVESCEPVALNGMFLRIATRSMHRCGEGDTIFMCDDERTIWYETNVVYVPDAKTIVVNVIPPDAENYINWIELADRINAGNIVVRRKNPEIPKYARMVSTNDFVWRDINLVGNPRNVGLEEYPFTNEAFYVSKQINFFLKRQDPDGFNNLHGHNHDEVFGDTDGLRKSRMENERTNDGEMVC